MSFTVACYTRGCRWKRTGAGTPAEALRWGQWHAVEMKWRGGQAHDTTCFLSAGHTSATACNRDSSSRTLPAPRTTQVSGSSARWTGR